MSSLTLDYIDRAAALSPLVYVFAPDRLGIIGLWHGYRHLCHQTDPDSSYSTTSTKNSSVASDASASTTHQINQNSHPTTPTMLNPQYLQQLQAQLAKLATQSNFESIVTTAFGTNIDSGQIQKIRQQWLNNDFSIIPKIDVLSNGELGTANGGYAASEDRIFVSSDFLAQHSDDSQAVTELLLEEVGHKLDRVLNGNIDSPGDEGEIFRLLASGQTLSPQMLAGLKAQDDRAVIIVGGKLVSIEQKSVCNGDNNDNKALLNWGMKHRFCPHPQPLSLDSLNRRGTRRARIAPKLGSGSRSSALPRV